MNADTHLQQAFDAVARLKPDTWEAVETLAILALAAPGSPQAAEYTVVAGHVAAGLEPGSWQSVRALAYLSMAERVQP